MISLFTTTRHGVSAKEIQRQTGVTYKTAWRMGQKVHEHMAEIDGEAPLGDAGHTVEIGETIVGGVRKGKRGHGAAGKTVVFGMLQREGDLMLKVVPNVRRTTLQPIIQANVRKGTMVDTDELKSYNGLSEAGYDHGMVNHSEGRHVAEDGTTVNAIENFWRHLKCSIKGTHTNVTPERLERYPKEIEYRFNRRMRPETMLIELLSTHPDA